ncbi:Hypothetical Protein FCC1311_036552, partial [Hondaea fermentalgiana]
AEAVGLRAEVANKLAATVEGWYCNDPYIDLVGEGFCREGETYGGEGFTGTGDFKLYKNVMSREECEQKCKDNSACKGYEYDSRSWRNTCEIHYLEVEAYKPKEGVECYSVERYCGGAYEATCKYTNLGRGWCRVTDKDGELVEKPEAIKKFCKKEHPCTQDACRNECSENDWCYGYQHKRTEKSEDGTTYGVCNLFTEEMTAIKESRAHIVCKMKKNKKKCHFDYDDYMGVYW